MKNIFSLYFIILSAILLSSCEKDQSTSGYTDISAITISGIDEKYTQIVARDTLKINPTIEQGVADADAYEYTWIRYTSSIPYTILDTISHKRNLNYPVEGNTGTYHVIYSVKNKANGLGSNTMFTLEVTSLYSKGFYFFKETSDGNSDMDLLIADGTLISDIVQKTDGTPLTGQPRSMGIMYNRPLVDPTSLTKTTGHCLGLVTYDKKVGIYRIADMYKVADHSSMFYIEPDDIPYKFYTNYIQSVHLSSSGIYSLASNSGTIGKYGLPVSTTTTGASDHWAAAVGMVGFVYWDETNRRILYHNFMSSPVQVANSINFPTLDLNYDCVFMGNVGYMIYILFRDKSDTSKMILYQLVGGPAQNPFGLPAVSSIRSIAATSKLHTATLLGINERTAQMIYFVNANKLYYYDLTNNTEVAISPQGLPEDEIITYVSNRFDYWQTPNLDYFTMATYKDGNYKVYMYNMVGGLPNGAPTITASGKGKIKEIHIAGTGYNSVSEANGFLFYGYSR